MKYNYLMSAFLLSMPMTAGTVQAQTAAPGTMQSKQRTFSDFIKQDGMKVHKAHFNVYEIKDKYYLEIPKESLGRDIMLATYVTRGYSSYVSDKSGIVNLSLAHDGQQLEITVNRPVEESADTSDVAMARAVAQSAMKPVDYVYPVECRGENGRSVIIDITNDLNSPSGLFNVSSSSLLSHPDPARSGVDVVSAIDNGVVFALTRTQTDTQNDPNSGKSTDFVNMFCLEILIQQMPYKHDMDKRADSPAFGFSTVTNIEYDGKKYVAVARKFITRWRLDTPITVYIDPATPAPFRKTIREAVGEWAGALSAAGFKDVFRFSSDAKDAHMGYHTIVFKWSVGFAGAIPQVIINNHTGEILTAQINAMDIATDELMERYFVQCGAVDQRIRRDMNALSVRQDLFRAMVAGAMGRIFGLKDDNAGTTALPLAALHDARQAAKLGPVASVTAGMAFNYVAKPADGIAPDGLVPKVSTYDYAAIKYAYGRKPAVPADWRLFYAGEDKLDPYVSKTALSSDIYSAAVQGIENVKKLYADIEGACAKLPAEQRTTDRMVKVGLNCLAQFQSYVTDMSRLVGGRSVRGVVNGVNEERTRYVPRQEQLKALEYIERNVLTDEVPAWTRSPLMLKYGSYDINHMTEGLCQSLLGRFTDKEVYRSLWHAETIYGNSTLTAKEVFTWLDRVVYGNFSRTAPVSAYKQSVSALFTEALARAMAGANIVYGITNEGNNMLHSYFLHIYDNVKELSKSHPDAATRDNYRVILMKMNREYFDKPLQ